MIASFGGSDKVEAMLGDLESSFRSQIVAAMESMKMGELAAWGNGVKEKAGSVSCVGPDSLDTLCWGLFGLQGGTK